MPRLAFALISVLAHVAAQETRITDLLEKEYVDEGCEAAGWGPFPTANATTLTAEAYSKAHGTSGCKCGMLYGLAHSLVPRKKDVAVMSSTVQAQGPTPCSGGTAAGFPCENVDLVAHLPLSAFTTNTGEAPAAANDLWGWTHKKREFVIWGVSEGHPCMSKRLPVPFSPAGPSPQRLTSLPSRPFPGATVATLAHVPPPSQFCA